MLGAVFGGLTVCLVITCIQLRASIARHAEHLRCDHEEYHSVVAPGVIQTTSPEQESRLRRVKSDDLRKSLVT